MAWCAGQSAVAVAGEDSNAEFFRVLRSQMLGEAVASPSLAAAVGSSKGNNKAPLKPGAFLEFMFLDLNKQSIGLLLQALYYHKSVHEIKTLVFHGCRIRDAQSLELLQHLFHIHTHWKHVEISCLCQALGNEQARILIMEIMKSPNLDFLCISSTAINDGLIVWKDLLTSPQAAATPSTIVMRSSRINFEHTREFLTVLPLLVEQTAKSSGGDKKWHFLKNLDLSACRMDDASVDIIASGLKTMNVQLESLALKGNRLSPKSIPVLAQLVHDHPRLRSLDLSMNTRLFSSDGEKAAVNLTKMIQAAIPQDNSRRMERLILSKTSVGEAAAIAMIESLESNHVLQELDLNFCLLGEKVMGQVVASLPKMKGLKQLLLHGLHFSQRNAATNPHDQRQSLWTALQENQSLVKIQGLNMFLGAGRPELASVILEHLSERNGALHEARAVVKEPASHPTKTKGDANKTTAVQQEDSATASTETDEDNHKVNEDSSSALIIKKPNPELWPHCLEKWGLHAWRSSAVFLFLTNNATSVAAFGLKDKK